MHNTYGERHCYLLHTDDAERADDRQGVLRLAVLPGRRRLPDAAARARRDAVALGPPGPGRRAPVHRDRTRTAPPRHHCRAATGSAPPPLADGRRHRGHPASTASACSCAACPCVPVPVTDPGGPGVSLHTPSDPRSPTACEPEPSAKSELSAKIDPAPLAGRGPRCRTSCPAYAPPSPSGSCAPRLARLPLRVAHERRRSARPRRPVARTARPRRLLPPYRTLRADRLRRVVYGAGVGRPRPRRRPHRPRGARRATSYRGGSSGLRAPVGATASPPGSATPRATRGRTSTTTTTCPTSCSPSSSTAP